MPMFISRESLCALADLELNTFRSMRQRGQVPAIWGDDPEAEARRGYTLGQAFLTIVANELVIRHGISRDVAARIAEKGNVCFQEKNWANICRTSSDLASGEGHQTIHVLFGRLTMADGETVYRCGTFSEVTAPQKRKGPSPEIIDMVAVSATQCAATMRRRAEEHDIDLGKFFKVSR